MAFEAPQHIGLVEKAAKLALKYGVTYNTTWREFRGDPERVQKATAALKQWVEREASVQFRAEREW